MSEKNGYILAMYDVRGKQDYIFRGRKLKEIVGGSLVIRDIFEDELFPAAKAYRDKMKNEKEMDRDAIYSYKRSKENNNFDRNSFQKHIEAGYLGEVVYDGGGNCFILYKDKATYEGINKIFTKRVLEKTYSLTVLCSCIEGVDFDNYTNTREDQYGPGDREKLYLVNREREVRINSQLPAQVLPFTRVDYANSLPLYDMEELVNARVTKESKHKYNKYNTIYGDKTNSVEFNSTINENVLDYIASEKGTDSQIAVMYIDGNNIGDKKKSIAKDGEEGRISYEVAIQRLRFFSAFIQKEYIDDRIEAIDKALEEKYKEEKGGYKRRLVIHAGDEINIILNAHDVVDAVKAYFCGMKSDSSACAGVAIFKSHIPYADAYRIAEQCCENCKALMKDKHVEEANLFDFHYCQGMIGTDLEDIRGREVGDIISKPWFVGYDESNIGTIPKDNIITLDMVQRMVDKLNQCSRTNIKGLLEYAKNKESSLFTELIRMQLRNKNDKSLDLTKLEGCDGKCMISNETLRKLIYDIVSVYDLWFRKEETGDEKKGKC